MTPYDHFRRQCRIRHDFGDQLQVRYLHDDGGHYDTWVSGAEALQRLESIEVEEQLKALSRLTANDLQVVLQVLPEGARNVLRRSLRDELADRLEAGIGGNLIGDALANAIRGRFASSESAVPERERWQSLMRYAPFRKQVLELAWIQLEGSFPDVDSGAEPDDWL